MPQYAFSNRRKTCAAKAGWRPSRVPDGEHCEPRGGAGGEPLRARPGWQARPSGPVSAGGGAPVPTADSPRAGKPYGRVAQQRACPGRARGRDRNGRATARRFRRDAVRLARPRRSRARARSARVRRPQAGGGGTAGFRRAAAVQAARDGPGVQPGPSGAPPPERQVAVVRPPVPGNIRLLLDQGTYPPWRRA